MMTAQEQYEGLKHLDLCSAVQPICDLCPRAEDCDGFFSKKCPFDMEIREVLEHLFDADWAIQLGIKSAEQYQEDYPDEYDRFEDVHNQPMYCISSGRYVQNYG